MFANIRSINPDLIEFDCRVKADPILAFKNVLVYELVRSEFPNEINKVVNNRIVGTFRHVALNTEGIGFLFDVEKNELSSSLGQCIYVA